jgi:hypothetical protein
MRTRLIDARIRVNRTLAELEPNSEAFFLYEVTGCPEAHFTAKSC